MTRYVVPGLPEDTSNDAYVAQLRRQDAKPLLQDLKETLPAVYEALHRQQFEDETPREYRQRVSLALGELTRIQLRLQDGRVQ